MTLSSLMVEQLQAHRARQAEELLELGVKLSRDSFVFAQADGSPIKPGRERLTSEDRERAARA
ncbi:hypothetical protein D6B98_14390 [Bradyrhizobium sp. LVM 105]|nr:hypothetical protein D6B98_14390 [Bradyrhizobium sp. LVM 105]